jgi:hypothetical protein
MIKRTYLFQPRLNKYQRSLQKQNDYEALRSDVELIGKDFRKIINWKHE